MKEEEENKETITRWSARIDETTKHLKKLQNPKLTYEKLLQYLSHINFYYSEKGINNGYTHKSLNQNILQEIDQAESCICQVPKMKPLRVTPYDNESSMHHRLIVLIKEDIIEKMKKYQELQGTTHPLLNKFK